MNAYLDNMDSMSQNLPSLTVDDKKGKDMSSLIVDDKKGKDRFSRREKQVHVGNISFEVRLKVQTVYG